MASDRHEQALKDLQADLTKLKFKKTSSGPTERVKSQDKIRLSDYCRIVEAKTYESKEVRFTQCEVLKVDLESESESEMDTPVPKVIERICKVCNAGEVQDEIHFLCVCAKYCTFEMLCIPEPGSMINISTLKTILTNFCSLCQTCKKPSFASP